MRTAPAGKSPKHAAQWDRQPAYAYPVFDSIAVQAVDVALVMQALELILQTPKAETGEPGARPN